VTGLCQHRGVVVPGPLVDLAVPNGAQAVVQLASGGDAVLSFPSDFDADQKIFALVLSLQTKATTALGDNRCTINVVVGDDAPVSGNVVGSIQLILPVSTEPIPAFFVIPLLWNSASGTLTNSSTANPTLSLSVMSQAALKFSIWASDFGAASDPGDILSVTQFKLQLI